MPVDSFCCYCGIKLKLLIVLFGAELIKGIGLYRFSSDRLESPLIQILIILEQFFRCHRKGEVVTEEIIRSHGQRIDLEHWPEYKSRLMEIGFIRGVERGGLVLSQDLAEVSVWDLLQLLPWQLPGEFQSSNEEWEKRVAQLLEEVADFGEQSLKQDLETLFRSEGSE